LFGNNGSLCTEDVNDVTIQCFSNMQKSTECK